MKEVKIAFTGDIAFSRYYKDKVEDFGIVAPELADFLTDTDYGVFNIEGAMAGPTHSGLFVHNNPPEGAKQVVRLKGNIWNLANNHVMDAGPEGCMETLAHAKENGCRTIGAGAIELDALKPVILPEAGGLGIFGMGYQPYCVPAEADKPGCSSWDKKDLIRKTVESIKKTCRWCVAVIHGGREFCDIPMKDIRDRYKEYLDMGVDIIVAHHPHVPQNYEKFGDKYVFYSLGNFIFDTDYQRAQFHTDTGVLIKLFFTEESVRFEAVGTRIDRSNGHISKAPLPAIFTCLAEKDYEILWPLAAERFISHIIKRLSFMYPDKYHVDPDPELYDAMMKREDKTYPHFRFVLEQAALLGQKEIGPEYDAIKKYLI